MIYIVYSVRFPYHEMHCLKPATKKSETFSFSLLSFCFHLILPPPPPPPNKKKEKEFQRITRTKRVNLNGYRCKDALQTTTTTTTTTACSLLSF